MRIPSNGIEIEIDDQGPPGGEPLLLIMGLGMQLIAWPDELVQQLVARGFRVLRIDNRDAGLSTQLDHLGVPNLAWAALRYAMHLPVHAPYGIADMAADAVGVLDALGVPAVHVCGASMGGMISQHLAATHPARVKSLTLMMTTTGARRLPQARAHVRRALLARPASADEDAIVAHLARVMELIGSPGFPPSPEQLRQRLSASVRRAWRPAGTVRQLAAIAGDGDRSTLVQGIRAPTRVIHGEADPLVPVEAGHELAARIRGAVLDIVPGMGHDLPQELLPRFAEGVAENAARAAAKATA
ncbi:MAG: alpha/beta fold hydrolase [Burkholderiales bacterium]|nr:alpha/beta fold hydrolase [Burkholderiales bacterium]